MFTYGINHLTAGKALAILHKKKEAKLNAAALAQVQQAHAAVMNIAAGEGAVYGINTGFGPLCSQVIPANQTSELQRNLLLSHSVGVGNAIDRDLSALMLILKVQALSQGYSGISPEVIERILWHLDADVIPVVPEQGSVGASGDLAPLSHLFLPLIGEGKVWVNGKIEATGKILQAHGLAPLDLEPKAGLALINGTQFILSHAIHVVEKLYTCLAHADLISALMIEGLRGSALPFHPALHTTRPFKGNVHVAARMRHFLTDSEIMESHENCKRVQDPYSLRCIPQVHGSSRNAWLHLKEAVEVEMNSVTDNPIIISKDFTISGGSFHGQPLALPIDYACLAASEIGNISDRRSYLSLLGKVPETPKLLLKQTGLHSGFMIVQYTSAALASENKGLCFPSSADSIPTSLGQEDHVSMGSIGGRKALQVCNNVIKILAAELLCAAQAFDFARPLRSSKSLEAVHACVRDQISHARQDRIFGEDLEKAINLIESRELLQVLEEFKPERYSEFDELFEVY